MSSSSNDQTVRLGTTQAIYVPRSPSDKPMPVRAGQDYFVIQVHSAQAAFTGRVWEQIKHLVVTSQVNLHHPILDDEDLRAIRRVWEVRKDATERLGLGTNLISLVPATMTHVSISIEFILDKQNRFVTLANLINDNSLWAPISLAPGAAATAKTISSLSQKIIAAFIPAEERQPLLQFTGDFNLDIDGLLDGYYVILGSRDKDHPLPTPLPNLEVQGGELLANGQLVDRLSYIVLDVRWLPVRARETNGNAIWDVKLREAAGLAQMIANDPFASNEQKEATWKEKCTPLLNEARTLLLVDSNYLPREAEDILKSVYTQCLNAITGMTSGTRHAGTKDPNAWQPDHRADRKFLGIPEDEDLDSTLDRYADQVFLARRIMKEMGA